MAKLNGKIALITGGTSGIGAATAKLFQAEGATVIVTGSSAKTVETARKELPGIEVVVSDQANTAASKALVDQVKAKHGRIDILFVNAGIGAFGPLESVDEAAFDRQFNTNVRGAYFVIKHAAPVISRPWGDRSDGVDRGLVGIGQRQCLFGDQGRAPLIRPDPRSGARASQHPGKHCESRPDRDPHLRKNRFDGGADLGLQG